jgi:hypothetical protein
VNIGREDQKGGSMIYVRLDDGKNQASVSGSILSIFANLCLLWLCCHKSPNGEIVANMAAIAICSSMILVIHTQHNHGTNQND